MVGKALYPPGHNRFKIAQGDPVEEVRRNTIDFG